MPCAAIKGTLTGDPRDVCGADAVTYKVARLTTPAFQESAVIAIVALCRVHDELSRRNAPIDGKRLILPGGAS